MKIGEQMENLSREMEKNKTKKEPNEINKENGVGK